MRNNPHSIHHLQRGRSLIELMVAILVGSLVLASVLVITAGSTSIGRRSDSLGALTDTGQVALQLLSSEIRTAGYSEPRKIFAAGYVTKMLPFAGIRGCDAEFASSNTALMSDLTCLEAAPGSTGAISVTYEADAFTSVLVDDGTGPAPSDCRGFGLRKTVGGIGNAAPPIADLTEKLAFWRVENRYFVGNSSTDGEPSLLCTGNGGDDPFKATTTLIRGVQRMVATYGVANGILTPVISDTLVGVIPGVASYMTATQIDANPAWLGETSETRWQRVVSVRMCLEIRGDANSAEPAASFINCDGTTTAITDRRARRAVYMTMSLRNRTAGPDSGTGIGFGGV